MNIIFHQPSLGPWISVDPIAYGYLHILLSHMSCSYILRPGHRGYFFFSGFNLRRAMSIRLDTLKMLEHFWSALMNSDLVITAADMKYNTCFILIVDFVTTC